MSSCLLLIPLLTNELRPKRANLNWKILAAVEQDELKSDDNWKTTEGVADMLKEYENAMCRYQIEIMKMESIRYYRKKVTQNTEWWIGCERGNGQIKLVIKQTIDNLHKWRAAMQIQITEYRKKTVGLKMKIMSTNMQSAKNTEWIQMDWKLRIIDKRQEWRSGQSLTFFLSRGFAHFTVLY